MAVSLNVSSHLYVPIHSGAFSIVGAKFTKMRNRPTVMKSYMIDMGTILISGGKAEISNQQALQAQK